MGPIMAFSAKLDSQQGGKALDPNKQFLSSLKKALSHFGEIVDSSKTISQTEEVWWRFSG